jgi:hypothetical protein
VGLGFEVERGKRASAKIRRPVLFGEQGVSRVTYEVDAVHDDLGILVEIEAGRGWMGNAVYRDLVRSALVVDARYLVPGVMQDELVSQQLCDRGQRDDHAATNAHRAQPSAPAPSSFR